MLVGLLAATGEAQSLQPALGQYSLWLPQEAKSSITRKGAGSHVHAFLSNQVASAD